MTVIVKKKMAQKSVKYLSFYIPEELKEEWSEFAKKLGRPLTKVIREAMNQLMYKDASKEKVDLITQLRNEITQTLDERTEKIQEMVSQAKLKSEFNSLDMEKRILSYLGDVKQVTTKKIAFTMGEEELDIQQVLVNMKKQNLVTYNTKKRLWSVN
ncbi:MAG: hypothetical protein JW870_11040 [Candidatus Delongbacteria bacterium]|nr:hypothetical protein [Candidatus Delongbacteria bacterium]